MISIEDFLAEVGLAMSTLVRNGVEIDEAMVRDRVTQRLGGPLPTGTEVCLWFPLNRDGREGWLARPLPITGQPVCGSDFFPWIYTPATTRSLPTDEPLYFVQGPVTALTYAHKGQAAIGLSRSWAASIKDADEQLVLRPELRDLVAKREVRIVTQVDVGVRERQQLIELSILLSAAASTVSVRWETEEPFEQPFHHILVKNPVDLSVVKAALKDIAFPDYSIFLQISKLLANQLGVPTYELKQIKDRPDKSEELSEPLEPWPQEVVGSELLDRKDQLIRRHIWLTEEFSTAITLWTTACYLVRQLDLFAILAISSPLPLSGKSQLCEVIAKLVEKPLMSTDISPASFFAVIDKEAPTLIIDEGKDFDKLSPQLHRIVNGSYKRAGAWVYRKAGNDVRAYSTFGPKVLALNGSLPWDTLSRCIFIQMICKPLDMPLPGVDETPSSEWGEIRQRTFRWIADNHFQEVATILGGATDRIKDNWRILFAIADVAGGCWPLRAQKAYEAMSRPRLESDNNTLLISRVQSIYQDHRMAKPDGFLLSSQVISDLNTDDIAWWYPIKPRTLAEFLKRFGVYPKQHRRGHAGRSGGGRGYFYRDLESRAFTYI
jgi:hypothetical protein